MNDMERKLTDTQLRRLGIRPVEDLLKHAVSSRVLCGKGTVITDVPYGPLNEYDELFIDYIYWSTVGSMEMMVLGNTTDEYFNGDELHVGPLSDLYSDQPFYVRYTDEFWANESYPSRMLEDF
jgi:hypothetical protein